MNLATAKLELAGGAVPSTVMPPVLRQRPQDRPSIGRRLVRVAQLSGGGRLVITRAPFMPRTTVVSNHDSSISRIECSRCWLSGSVVGLVWISSRWMGNR